MIQTAKYAENAKRLPWLFCLFAGLGVVSGSIISTILANQDKLSPFRHHLITGKKLENPGRP